MKNRPFTPIRDGILLDVRATANSSRVGLFGVYVDDHSNHSLRIAVRAPATKGDANKAIIKQILKKVVVSRQAGSHLLVEGVVGISISRWLAIQSPSLRRSTLPFL